MIDRQPQSELHARIQELKSLLDHPAVLANRAIASLITARIEVITERMKQHFIK